MREQFSRFVGPVIDKVPGLRCTSYGYQSARLRVRWQVSILSTGQLVAGALYDLDFDHQFIETEKYDAKMTYKKIVEFYNLRGDKERIFDDMNNGFGWARLPKSFMAENTVFLLLTALIRNFYKFLMGRLDTKAFGLKKTSRIKAFVFKFISVPAKLQRQENRQIGHLTAKLARRTICCGF